MGNHFNAPLAIGVLPPSITHLNFSNYYMQNLERGIIPPLVEVLRFYGSFYESIQSGVIPRSVTKLQIFFKLNSIDDISTSTKIITSIRFYELYLNHGFYKVSFSTSTKPISNKFDEEYVVKNENIYLITKKILDEKIKITFRLQHCNIKSARKF